MNNLIALGNQKPLKQNNVSEVKLKRKKNLSRGSIKELAKSSRRTGDTSSSAERSTGEYKTYLKK